MTVEKRKFFDDSACNWDDLFYRDKEINHRLNSLTLKFYVEKGDRIIDLGCGTGIISERLSRLAGKKGKVFCCDFSIEMLGKAKEKGNQELDFVCLDAHKLTFRDNSFDSIICFSCFPHFEDKKEVMRETNRVLKKGGSFIISHLLSSREIAKIHRQAGKAVARDKMPSKKVMAVNLKKMGFIILEFLNKNGLFLLRAEKIRDVL